MTYTVSSGTLNTSIPYHTIPYLGLCSQLRPDVRDIQTSKAHHCLMPPTLGAGA